MPFVLDAGFVAKQLESKIKMPTGAHALTTYKRHYAVERTSAGDVYVVGTFIYDAATPGVLIVALDDLPRRFDGGCDVIDVRYSIASGRVLSAQCNGVA